MLIFAGVDGTGPRKNALYAAEFSNSFVQRMYRGWAGKGPARYSRGPNDLGYSTSDLAEGAARFVETAWNREVARYPRNPRIGVFLAGYSRGGAAVLDACWRLQEVDVKVDCLILCDAVERTAGYLRTTIPPNVSVCYHAVRSEHTFSRRWFGNCGRRVESRQTTYHERSFHCTHGGVGGVPWLTAGTTGAIEETGGWMDFFHGNAGQTNITPLLDNLVAEQVWAWLNTGLQVSVRKWSAGHELGTVGSTRPLPHISAAGY